MKPRANRAGVLLRRARENPVAHRYLSQQGVANALSAWGLHGQMISNIERGKCGVPAKHVARLCSLLGIPREEMIAAMVEDYRDNLIAAVETGGGDVTQEF